MGTLSIRLPADLEARLSAIFDLVSDLAGNFTGPRDLSSNKKDMGGFGR